MTVKLIWLQFFLTEHKNFFSCKNVLWTRLTPTHDGAPVTEAKISQGLIKYIEVIAGVNTRLPHRSANAPSGRCCWLKSRFTDSLWDLQQQLQTTFSN